MSENDTMPPARAILIGHGEFSAGLASAVEQITGMADRFVCLSNTGMDPTNIESALRSQVEATGATVIFTDLPAGSATLAARRVARDLPELVLVSGVNLATLLDFACSSAPSPGEAARAAAERGRASLVVLERR
jgi:PTS system N-acetylgalactosamine-specific IIA component